MTRRTPDRHAHEIAALMGLPLEETMAQDLDCAMLVMLLYAVGYGERQIRDLLLRHGVTHNRDHMDIALDLYRSDNNRRLQYRLIIDQLNREDERTTRKAGRTAEGGGKEAEGGNEGGVRLAGGQRGPSGLRGPGPRTALHPTAATEPSKAHHQHRQR